MNNIHGSDILDAEAFLGEGDYHFELATLSSVSRVWDRYGHAWSVLINVVSVVGGIGCSHGEGQKRAGGESQKGL
jgi:hypothetical protein